MTHNKYRVASKDRRTSSNGKLFASRAEMLRYEELLLLCKANKGMFIVRQPPVDLGADTTYRPDFLVVVQALDFGQQGECYFEDVKGVETREFRHIRKLWAKYGPCDLCVLKRKGDKWNREIVEGRWR